MFRLQNYIYNINTARRRGQQAQFLLPLVFFFLFFLFCGFAETEVTGLNLLGFCGALLRPGREGEKGGPHNSPASHDQNQPLVDSL